MEQYSHEAFHVSGYKVRIPNKHEEQKIIKAAWKKFMEGGLSKLIENKAYIGVHAVYYNYKHIGDLENEGYDMLLGFITNESTKQSSPEFVDFMIPAQDYMYTKASGNFAEVLPLEWNKVNKQSKSEVPRKYGYDLEMYSEDFKTVTLAVSVNI
jgi:predicted transcriptional regulator YdeE